MDGRRRHGAPVDRAEHGDRGADPGRPRLVSGLRDGPLRQLDRVRVQRLGARHRRPDPRRRAAGGLPGDTGQAVHQGGLPDPRDRRLRPHRLARLRRQAVVERGDRSPRVRRPASPRAKHRSEPLPGPLRDALPGSDHRPRHHGRHALRDPDGLRPAPAGHRAGPGGRQRHRVDRPAPGGHLQALPDRGHDARRGRPHAARDRAGLLPRNGCRRLARSARRHHLSGGRHRELHLHAQGARRLPARPGGAAARGGARRRLAARLLRR